MKFATLDRYDNLTFRNERFIHKDSYVSSQQDSFSIECGRIFGSKSRRGSKFGVNKREPRLSGCGYFASKCSIGNGD